MIIIFDFTKISNSSLLLQHYMRPTRCCCIYTIHPNVSKTDHILNIWSHISKYRVCLPHRVVSKFETSFHRKPFHVINTSVCVVLCIVLRYMYIYDRFKWRRTRVVCFSWWRHQMEKKISALLSLCAGNTPVTGEFPAQRASNAELWCFFLSAPEWTVG